MKLEEAREELSPALYVKLKRRISDLEGEARGKVVEKVVERFQQMQIEPGEGIGTVTAQSLGEPGTQLTLETFHHAGVAEISVTKGLPRMIEIFDARRSPSTPSMSVFLKKEYAKDKEKARQIASDLLEIKVEDIASEINSDILELEIEVVLDEDSLEELDVDKTEVVSALDDEFSDLNVDTTGSKVILSPSDEVGVKDLYELVAEINDTYIKGVKGITQVLVKKRDDLSGTARRIAEEGEYVIKTAGSNLRKMMKLPKVDGSRTLSNDLWEIYRVLGVEAVRRAIVNEAVDTLEDQGLEVDIRHILLVADMMTASGELQGTTRYGIAGNKSSILHRASFEVALKHLLNAAAHNGKDELKGIVENVMVNQTSPVGTGYPKLVVKGNEGKDKGS